MKKVFTLGILCSLLSYTALAQEFNLSRGAEFCSKKKSNSQIPLVKSPNTPRHAYNVLDYNLDLDIMACYSTPYPKNFNATAIITFKVDSTLSSISLDAVNSSLLINSVGGAGTSFTHVNDKLTIVLDQTYYPGSITQVLINYSHKNTGDQAFNVGNGLYSL